MQRLEGFASRFFRRQKADEVKVASKIKEDPSEDLDFLLAQGQVEQLVREKRTPLKIGTIGSPGSEMQSYYQVPPRGFNPEDIDHVYMAAGGVCSFVYKDGSQRIGSTYTLTEEQAQLLECRVSAERERIDQS